MGRCWGAEAGIFPISDSSGLIRSGPAERGGGGVASQISSSRQPQQRAEAARGKQTAEAAALAQKGELFGNRVAGGPLCPGAQSSARLVSSWGRVG